MTMPLARVQQRLQELNNWGLEGATDIAKEFTFQSFEEAIKFVNEVAVIARENNHHPTILVSYNLVRITLTTHSEHGLTPKDFDVAEAIDKLSK